MVQRFVERIKAEVRARDGHRCTSCGRTSEESRRRWRSQLQVHRVVPGSLYSTRPGVCVTLCLACHAGVGTFTPHTRIINTKAGRRHIFVKPRLWP